MLGFREALYVCVPRGVLNVIGIGIEFQINQARIFYDGKIALPAHLEEIGLRLQMLFHCKAVIDTRLLQQLLQTSSVH